MQKFFGAGLIASSVFTAGIPVFAADGDGARISIFGDSALSSPFTVNEQREDPIYSPYSAYGNGEASIYKKGGKDELIRIDQHQISVKKCVRCIAVDNDN